MRGQQTRHKKEYTMSLGNKPRLAPSSSWPAFQRESVAFLVIANQLNRQFTNTINSGDLKNVRLCNWLGPGTDDEGKLGLTAGATGKRGLTPARDIPPQTATMAARMRSVHRNPPTRVRRKLMRRGKIVPPTGMIISRIFEINLWQSYQRQLLQR